jgi:hypothetical protein
MSEHAFRYQPEDTRDTRMQQLEDLRQAILAANDYDLRRAWHTVMNFIEDEAKIYENTMRSSASPGRARRARVRSATARSLQDNLNRVFRLEVDDYDEEEDYY